MKQQELSERALTEGQKMARATMKKRGERSYQTVVTLREDELTALLARAFDAGGKAKRS